MGRPKKNGSDALVEVVNDYYTNGAQGDPRKLKYSNLAKHAEKLGIQAAWYDFQRDAAVLKRIAELRAKEQSENDTVMVPAYKSLDIEALLNHCGTVEELKQKLYELDSYWKKAYDEAVKISAQDRTFSERIQSLEQEKADQAQRLAQVEQRIKELERENAYLRRTIRENIYPAVANELLRESNLPVQVSETVMPEALSHLIEGSIPQPLGGVQQPQKKALTRQEQLIEDLQRQVKENGKQ